MLKGKKGWIICAVLAVIALAMTLAFTFGAVGYGKEAVDGRGTFDEQTSYYDAEYMRETISLMSAEDKADYISYHVLDYFYVLAYGALMFVTLYKLSPEACKTALAAILTALTAAVDLCENICVDVALKGGAATGATGAFTLSKWILLVLWVILLVILGAIKIVKFAKARRTKTST